MVFFSLMLLTIAGAIVYGIAKHFLVRYRSQPWHLVLEIGKCEGPLFVALVVRLCQCWWVTASLFRHNQTPVVQETVPVLLVPSKSILEETRLWQCGAVGL